MKSEPDDNRISESISFRYLNFFQNQILFSLGLSQPDIYLIDFFSELSQKFPVLSDSPDKSIDVLGISHLGISYPLSQMILILGDTLFEFHPDLGHP